MLKRHEVKLHHFIKVYNNMIDHMDGVMRGLAKKKTQWKEYLVFTMKFAGQELSKHYAEVTPSTGMHLISADTLDPLRNLQWFRRWDTGMDIHPEDETSYTTQHPEAVLKYEEYDYCAKHRRVPVNKPESILSSNLVRFATASGSGQASCDRYDLSSDDEEYLTPNNVAETTPRRSHCAAHILTAARRYHNSPAEAPKHWGQINPNLNDYHSDTMESSSSFCLLDITNCWCQQEETHSKYADLSDVVRDIFFIIPPVVRVEASFPLGEMLSAGGSQKPQATQFAKTLL